MKNKTHQRTVRPALKAKKSVPPSPGFKSQFSIETMEAFFSIWTPYFHKFLGGALVLAGIFVCFEKNFIIGVGLIFSGFSLLSAEKWIFILTSSSKYGLVIVGGLLIMEALANVHDYAALLPQGLIFSLGNYAGLLFILGCLLVFWGFRFSTDTPKPIDDIAPWQGWFGLALLLIFSLSTSLRESGCSKWLLLRRPSGAD